jgi:DNA-binding CsgD family transcriptional regulator/tetratricopeptide (TPR) repeat protein
MRRQGRRDCVERERAQAMVLLERDELLEALRKLRQRASAGEGILLFVEGGAGLGKTSLLQTFCEQQDVPVYWGSCEPLQTPRPLGPLHDIAGQIGGDLQRALSANAARWQIFGTFLDAIRKLPCVVVIEDLHWADDATLDFLRHIGRRALSTRALLVASFSSDAIGPVHPLRAVLGDLTTGGAKQLTLQPLSIVSLKQLIGDRNIDAVQMHRITAGNPFFVTEVLAADDDRVLPTVTDAVLFRAARLHPPARAILDAAAVAGPRIESWLLQELTGEKSTDHSDVVDECLVGGMLRAHEGVFVFRHELTRQAVLEALAPTQLLRLHRRALRALQSPSAPVLDVARLADHAEEAASAEAVLQFAPVAARDAAAKGSHRQAVQQFARALRFAFAPTPQRAALLDEYASECQLSGMINEAVEARTEVANLWRDLGDSERQAISLARLADTLILSGRHADGETKIREALTLIGSAVSTAAAVTVRRWTAHLRMLDRDADEAIRHGEIAIATAERLGDRESVIHCLNTVGSAMILAGRTDEGTQRLEASLGLAEQLHWDAWMASAFVQLGSAFGEVYQFDLADRYLRRGVEFCTDRDLDGSRLYQLAWQALVWMYRGRWTEASGVAHVVLADQRSPLSARIIALIALGRVRARRGESAVWEALDEAKDLAGNARTLQQLALMQAARAEAAWFEGRAADAASEASVAIELALRKRHPWFASELLFWCWQGDGSLPGGLPDFCARHPYALEISGHWQEADAAWRRLKCPFEAARALAEGPESAQREALSMFEAFSSRPMIERVRYKLRGPHRGARESSLSHAGLTSKEVQMLALLAQGLGDKEIGERLKHSTRTLDHRLTSIFTKLDVSTRAEAVSIAYRLGVVTPPK